ncbi:MAG: NAD(P)/FAD-dependent oxidoreductase [Planctomycetota bacterium]|nr:MAG: NAD(P)/FAD-dependent oxidoreductase [Planctomycetota bacterium]
MARDPLEGARARYDVVVVGSGLAGLTAAVVLGRAGHSVCVLEQHYNLGGMATWFKRRGGHVFDISLHGFPIGMQKTCRRYWNAAIASRIVRLDGVRFANPQFELDTAFTREDFTQLLVERFGVASERVHAFFEHIRALDFYAPSRETIRELFERWFPGRNDVHRLLLEPISYANGSTLDDPAIAYGIVFSNFMSRGVYTFAGGTDLLVKEMRAELARVGVEVFHSVQVERILVEGSRARGVLAHGREIAAGCVVSNASVKTTVLELVGAAQLPADYVDATRAVRLNNSSCQVYMGLAPDAGIPFVGDLLFSSTRREFDSSALCDLHGESRTFSFYYPKTRPELARTAIVSSTNANWADWAALSPQRYEVEKAALIEETLVDLERHLPGIRARIDHIEAATPRTFQFYTQQPLGTSFGTKFEGLQVSFDLPRHVGGLFHAGSVGIIMSGWLGAANYGAIVANKADAWLRTGERGAGERASLASSTETGGGRSR